jgi:hypothetical protein
VQLAQRTLFKVAHGNIINFDAYLPMVQFMLNNTTSSKTASSRFALALGRPCNALADHAQAESKLLSETELEQRTKTAHELIYPAVAEAAAARAKEQAEGRDADRQYHKPIAVGSAVMLLDQARSAKWEPRWVGPYVVVKRTRAGTYSLVDSKNALLGRSVPADQIKLVAPPGKQDDKQRAYVVKSVLDHRGPDGKREYLVAWQGYGDDENSWVPQTDFEDLACIQTYWRRRETKAKQEHGAQGKQEQEANAKQEQRAPAKQEQEAKAKQQQGAKAKQEQEADGLRRSGRKRKKKELFQP